MVTIHADPVPVEAWSDGSIRVGGTRLLLDTVAAFYERGESPEAIATSFAMPDSDIYGAIAYFLRHRQELTEYFARRDAEAAAMRARTESDPGNVALIAKLRRARERRPEAGG